jgi:ABC-2 type transport system ATP-binding protein
MSAAAIEVQGLRKVYTSGFGRTRVNALEGIDFEVQPGELFGLLGPNGAGKTTTVKIILGLTHATEGVVRVSGLPVSDPASRARVGYLPEGHKIPPYLTARQALAIFGRMSGMTSEAIAKRTVVLLDRVHLSGWRDVRVRKFSKGMTQRLGLACALIHEPSVLLLDEPTDGVDPVGRREIRDLLQQEAREHGTAVLLNSHLLGEIELTCDRVAVLSKGRVAVAGPVAELTRSTSQYRLVASAIDETLIARLSEIGARVERGEGHILLAVDDVAQLNAAIDATRASGSLISEVTPLRSSLEDIFVGLVSTPEVGAANVQNG